MPLGQIILAICGIEPNSITNHHKEKKNTRFSIFLYLKKKKKGNITNAAAYLLLNVCMYNRSAPHQSYYYIMTAISETL